MNTLNALLLAFVLGFSPTLANLPSLADSSPAVRDLSSPNLAPNSELKTGRRVLGIPCSDAPVAKVVPCYPEVPAWSEGFPNPNAWEIDKLCDLASQYNHDRQYDKAETTLNQAIVLNEAVFNPGTYRYLCDELERVLGYSRRFSEQEKTLETMSRRLGLWNSPQFREHVATFYVERGRYPEARVILSMDVPKMKPPPMPLRGGCGTSFAMYAIALERYKKCTSMTKDLTEEQFKQIERELKFKYADSQEIKIDVQQHNAL